MYFITQESFQRNLHLLFSEDEAAGPSDMLAPISQLHDVTAQKTLILKL